MPEHTVCSPGDATGRPRGLPAHQSSVPDSSQLSPVVPSQCRQTQLTFLNLATSLCVSCLLHSTVCSLSCLKVMSYSVLIRRLPSTTCSHDVDSQACLGRYQTGCWYSKCQCRLCHHLQTPESKKAAGPSWRQGVMSVLHIGILSRSALCLSSAQLTLTQSSLCRSCNCMKRQKV